MFKSIEITLKKTYDDDSGERLRADNSYWIRSSFFFLYSLPKIIVLIHILQEYLLWRKLPAIN